LFICAKYLLLEATEFSLPQYQAWQIGDTCSGEPLSPRGRNDGIRKELAARDLRTAPTVRQNVMAVTAICSVVSFFVGGLRDRHLTEATVVLGVVVANSSGDHSKRMRTWLLRTPRAAALRPI
jgi:hypothetical protein